MTRIGLNVLATGLALGLAGGAAAAPVDSGATTLTLVVEGRTARAPDIAQISGGVVTSAPTASAAMAENARKMNDVVATIRKAGIADRDVQTAGINLQPQYRYADNQPPVLTGYQASNTVSLRIRRIPEAGKLLDTLVNAGVNQISGPNFQVEDTAAALDEARAAAVKEGRTRAQLYAAAAGLSVKRIMAISESGAEQPGPQPIMMTAMRAKAESAPTPVSPGEVALTINVTMTFELQ